MNEDPFMSHRTWHLNRVRSDRHSDSMRRHGGGGTSWQSRCLLLVCSAAVIGFVTLVIVRAA